jgi:cytochrome c553
VKDANVPVCASCHGGDARGTVAGPRLAGQLYRYSVKVLNNWAIINRERGGEGGQASVKAPIEHKLNKDQIEAVAAYISELK